MIEDFEYLLDKTKRILAEKNVRSKYTSSDINLMREKLNQIGELIVEFGDTEFSPVEPKLMQQGSTDILVDTLLKQNEILAVEVNRLLSQLDEATNGILKRGYLYKWRDREMAYASKWGLRFFELRGRNLSYYEDDSGSRRPRRTIDLTNCIVRNEGTKKNGQFYVFGIYLAGIEVCERGPLSSVLLRLSCESSAEAEQWMDMLHQACETPKEEDMSSSNKSIEDNNNLILSHKSQSCTALSSISAVLGSEFSKIPHFTRTQIESIEQTINKSMIHRNLSTSRDLKDFDPEVKQLLSSQNQKNLNSDVNDVGNDDDNSHTFLSNKATNMPPSPSKLKHKKFHPKAFPASKPIHVKNNASPLSSDVRPSEQNYRGFFHLGLIIFALSHFRLINDNLVKYGLLFHIPEFNLHTCISPDHFTYLHLYLTLSYRVVLVLFSWACTIFIPFFIEKMVSLPRFQKIPEPTIVLINVLIGTCNILGPILWVWTTDSHPCIAMIYLFQSVILWCKMVSYVHVNRDLRIAAKMIMAYDKSSDKPQPQNYESSQDLTVTSPSASPRARLSARKENLIKKLNSMPIDTNAKPMHAIHGFEIQNMEAPLLYYPLNLTISHLLYFCVVPTLSYQMNYPRSTHIRWRYVATLVLRLILVGIVIIFFIEQYMVPTLVHSLQPMKERNIYELVVRLSKLSIPNTYVWLLGFYLFFHLWLNLLAELTRFGDRLFYKDWWNARTIDIYWRSWNLPVHHWMLRHVYYPLLRSGASKPFAAFFVFTMSALFHEVIISTPFRKIYLHAFLGMAAQVPLIYLTKRLDKIFDNALVGNVAFWLAFCVLGQPMGIIMYYFDIWKDSQ